MFRILFVLLLTLPIAAFGQTELHAVGVYEGNIKTDGRIHGGQVRVLVDRTENPVILSIGSYEPVRWYIETTSDTRIETILLHGYQPERSEVFLNDIPVTPRIIDASYAYKNKGSKFRGILNALYEETGLDRLASFNGAYSATSAPFVVDQIVLDSNNQKDHLKDVVRPDAIPSELRPFLDMAESVTDQRLSFTYDGFTLTEGDTVSVIPPTLDVPDISHPVGAAYDEPGGRMFGVTLGGEGFIYQYDMATDQWSVLASMEQKDANSILYDEIEDRLIFGYGLMGAGIGVYDFRTGQLNFAPVSRKMLPGFTDLYDVGNGPSADLVPIAVSGDMLLVRAGGNRIFRREPKSTRTYLINIRTGDATLVDYKNAG